jgi:hypothetical protein
MSRAAYQAPATLASIATPMRERSGANLEARVPALLRSPSTGAGLVVVVSGYLPFFAHLWQVGTSPVITDFTRSLQLGLAPAFRATIAYGDALVMPIADQAREVLAALSLNKSQLAAVLRISRPTLYEWLDGAEPNPVNAARITALLRLLAQARVTSLTPLIPKLVRQPLHENGVSIFEGLAAEVWDEKGIEELLHEARLLGEKSRSRRRSREERLRALGYEEPSDEQRKALLNNNLAMRDWPK